MEFGEAWQAIAVGATVKVSNGAAPPTSNKAGVPYRVWRSHNFTGTLAEKIDGEFRAMRFELANEHGNRVGYAVAEGGGHRFEAVRGKGKGAGSPAGAAAPGSA